MKWTLTWEPDADDRLTDLLAGADARVILAVARLAAVLETCPRSFGESRDPGRRYGFESPLGVWYALDEAARGVRVLDIKRIDRRPEGEDANDPDDET